MEKVERTLYRYPSPRLEDIRRLLKDCGKQAGSAAEISEKRVESSQKYRGRGEWHVWFLNVLGLCLVLQSMSHFNVERLPLSVIFTQRAGEGKLIRRSRGKGFLVPSWILLGQTGFIAGHLALSSGPCWQA